MYIDEAGISVAYQIKRGRSLIGTTPVRNVRQIEVRILSFAWV